ncbi:MAG: response regulator [Planctomycetes bacterium]|nr:response regulator [Planctomycetota bacterium]
MSDTTDRATGPDDAGAPAPRVVDADAQGATRVLVVDDNPTNVVALVRSLQKSGYEVLTAEDGVRAVEVATREKPDLVLLDMVMPGRDGFEVCTILKRQQQTASIPVIFVTATSEASQIVKAFAAGGCDYVTKPFRVDEILARVSVHIRLRRAERELRQKTDQLRDLAHALAETNVNLAQQARVDPLTSLLNRGAWQESARLEHERSVRKEHPYSVVMLDVDHFKALNDSLGHPAGDDCLRRLAACLTITCRRIDLVGRYGGEEFVVLAPETDADGVKTLAERVQRAVWEMALSHPSSPVADRVTVSMGVATYVGGALADVIRRADEALYTAKRSGRNRVCVAPASTAAAGTSAASDPFSSAAPSTPAEAAPEGQINVLVVDDNPTNRAVCRGCLTRKGYRVREAGDGRAALEAVRQEAPDVIILDVMMPVMDGLECTRVLKADAHTRDVPIIILSAQADATDILAGLEAGADEYLTKPIRTTDLEIRVRSMAKLRTQHVELLTARQAEAARRLLEAEVAERRRAEARLKDAKEAAEAASKAKSEFLATMSHELRTPLNGVIGMTNLLLGTPLDTQQQRYAAAAQRSADSLLRLINDILDFSKIEAGKLELERVPFDVRDVLDSTAGAFTSVAEAKQLRLDCKLHAPGAVPVCGDPARLQQVLANLASNAIKFTESGRILIQATIEEESAEDLVIQFTVTDTGIGIPADRVDRLFQSFSQVDASTTRKFGGTGLGLAICKKLVSAMGGQIGVQSELGLGSTFWCTVRLAKPTQSTPEAGRFLHDLRRVRILVASEDSFSTTLLNEQLTGSGLAHVIAASAGDALARLEKEATSDNPFHMIIIDQQLTDMSCEQLAAAIKAQPAIRGTILILLTPAATHGEIDRLITLGFTGVLAKPASQSRLLNTIVDALACARARTWHPAEDAVGAHEPVKGETAEARILVAEDNEIGQMVVHDTLTNAGYRCALVANGRQAVEAVAQGGYDLVLMDCQMPEMDGFEATRRIRAAEALPANSTAAPARIPIIALTANAIRGDREVCLEAGMDDYVPKPLDPVQLVAAIEAQLRRVGKAGKPPAAPPAPAPAHAEHVTTGAHAAPPFNLDAILKTWGGDRGLAGKLIAKFQLQAPADLSRLRELLAAGQAAEFGRIAHSLKGAAAYVAAERVRELALRLEQMGRAGDLTGAEADLDALSEEVRRCLKFSPPDLPLPAATPAPATSA